MRALPEGSSKGTQDVGSSGWPRTPPSPMRPEQDAGRAAVGIGMPSPMGGSLTAPTAPQTIDVDPGRCEDL